jgi:hypothetical protein
VRRELHESLQAALGDLARVEIVPEHPLLAEVQAKGLQQALDGWNLLSDAKIHFVLIDFADGRYVIQARQYDGLTGLASPVVRRSENSDRQLVAHEAALLVDKDFGMVGTIAADARGFKASGDKVDIFLKGGKVGAPLDHWVKKGDVFAVAQIIKQGGARQRSYRVPWTLLQVASEPKEGVCHCRLFYRHENPLPSAATVAGYRCLKLGTTQGPLRLRIVADDRSSTPLPGLQVQVGDNSFQDPPRERTSTRADGFVKSDRPYTNVAFVRILKANVPLAQVPVEILDTRTVTCSLSVQPGADRRGHLYARRDRWIRRLYDSLDVSATLVREINAPIGPARADALAKAEGALKGLQDDIADLTGEQEVLRKDAQALKIKLDLGEGDQRLQELRGQRDELQHFITELTDIVQKEKDPQRQLWRQLVEQARLLEGQADFAGALALYERVVREGGGDPKLRQYVDALKRAWTLKPGSAHVKARAFIYETWPKLQSAAQLKANLDQARAALRACQDAGDSLSPRMLVKANGEHAARLEKEAGILRPQESEDDRKTAESILVLTEELKKLNHDARDLARRGKSETK